MNQKRAILIALDWGDKSIGVAYTDGHRLLANPAKPIRRRQGSLALGEFRKLFGQKSPVKVLVGLPLNMDGTHGAQAKKAKAFMSKLKRHFPEITFEGVDERLSTWETRRKYKHLRLAKSEDEKNIDSFSAMELLQSYLERLD